MRKFSRLASLSLCLSSLAVAVSLVTGTSLKTTATPDNPIVASSYSFVKSDNVGGPLAQKLQGKPVVVDIYASWCSACKNIAPTLSQLKQDYNGKAHFIVFDVTDKAKASQSEAKAKELGLSQFFSQNKTQTGMVAIIDPATGNVLAQHRNNTKLADYTSVLNTALSQK